MRTIHQKIREKKKLTPHQIQEIELFRQIQEDERDYYDCLKDNEPQDPDK